ncbi:UNVERIFIED_CONTAM: hypothetical protein FKN15_074887 [Acipenser sinensis]
MVFVFTENNTLDTGESSVSVSIEIVVSRSILDASWELEENAYSELLQSYQHCDVRHCFCRKGREYSQPDSKWEIVRCQYCGSRGTHRSCSSLKRLQENWVCTECRAIIHKTGTLQRTSVSSLASSPMKNETAKQLLKRSPKGSRLSAPYHRDIPSRQSLQTLPAMEILKELEVQINPLEFTRFTINKEDVFKGALCALRRKGFDPHHLIAVKFTNTRTSFEIVANNHGQRREFLRLLMHKLENSSLFEGSCSKNLALDPQENIVPTLEDLADACAKQKVKKIEEALTQDELQTAIKEASEYLAVAGCLRPDWTLCDKEILMKDILNFHLITRMHVPIQRFCEGLKILGLLEKIQLFPEAFAELFCHKPQKLTSVKLGDLFTVHYSLDGNRKLRETKVIGFWRQYLQDCEDSACPVSLETILVFATAADAVPPMGFVPEPSIEFLHSQGQLQEIFPQGETSFNSLKLPIVQTYEEFRRNMDYAICYTALKRMLNFNVPPVKNSASEPVWKVLIYDRFGQDIISPLLAVKELRDIGITLHLLLHSDRDPIPDVPAIYFVMPTEENIDRICQDLRNQLYESYYLNFISAISRSKLEDIASAALGANAVNQVTKKLDKKLRENLRDARNSLFTGDTIGAGQFRHYLLLLLLLQDFHLNRVDMEVSTGHENSPAGARPKKKNKKSYDLTASDKFWQKHKGRVDMEVSTGHENSPAGARPKKKNKKSYDLTASDKFWQKHKGSSLPELLEKKRLIDLHTNVATAVLEHIKTRKLDVYFECEEKLMSKSTLDKSLLDMISDPDAGTPEDKMRLFLIYYISSLQPPSENLPVTRILDSLMDMKSNPAIVFVVGGGNYIEYQNLVDYTKVSGTFSNKCLFAKSASFYNSFIYMCMSSKFCKDLRSLFHCLSKRQEQEPVKFDQRKLDQTDKPNQLEASPQTVDKYIVEKECEPDSGVNPGTRDDED